MQAKQRYDRKFAEVIAKAKIALAILCALLFGFGVYCALAGIGLNAELSFSLGWLGFAVAVLYLDEREALKDRIAEIEQEQKREAEKYYVNYQEYLRQQAESNPTGSAQ